MSRHSTSLLPLVQCEMASSWWSTLYYWLIFGKIVEIVSTRVQILKLKCTKFDVRWGSVPDPAGFMVPTSKKRENRKGEGCKGKVEEM